MNNPFEILLQPTEKKAVHTQKVVLEGQSGRYHIGKPTRPNIVHDNGFLDVEEKRAPTKEDYEQLSKWKRMLWGAELLCNNELLRKATTSLTDKCASGALHDATAAYRHFLEGKGKPYTVDYEKYLREDSAALELKVKLRKDFQKHMEIIGKDRVKFSVTSEAYAIGPGKFAQSPASENWQKTIGAHYIWISADVTVTTNKSAEIVYRADVTIHMEDKYNFNPGKSDEKTGIADKENGRFEVTGLGQQFLTYGTAKREWEWIEGQPAPEF